MSQENIDVVRRFQAAFNRLSSAVDAGAPQEIEKATAEAFRFLDPELEVQDHPQLPGATWRYGFEGARQWGVQLWQAFGNLRFEWSKGFEARDGRVVAYGSARGQGRRSGIVTTFPLFGIFTVRGGKIKRVEVYETEAQALQAAGLSEELT